MKYVISINEKY